MKCLFSFLAAFFLSACFAADAPYKKLLKDRFIAQSLDMRSIYGFDADAIARLRYRDFPEFKTSEVDAFLRNKHPDYYDGYHPMIGEYIEFFTEQSTERIAGWFGLFDIVNAEMMEMDVSNESILGAMLLSRIRLLPVRQLSDAYVPGGMNASTAIYYGLEVNQYVDERYILAKHIPAMDAYLNDLEKRLGKNATQLSSAVLGAATIKKAKLSCDSCATYWDLYPYIRHEERDFYPALLAASFVYQKRKEWLGGSFDLKLNVAFVQSEVHDTLHMEQIAHILKLEPHTLELLNPQYINLIVPPESSFVVPTNKLDMFEASYQAIHQYDRHTYFPPISDSCYVFYRTVSGDYFRDLTRWFGVGLEEIKQTNGFTSNTLPKNWDVVFKVHRKDSLKYANFDQMSRQEKDALSANPEQNGLNTVVKESTPTVKPTTSAAGKKITYIVKSGDSLWSIGRRYNVTDADIMKWNKIGSNIYPGQAIIIYLP